MTLLLFFLDVPFTGPVFVLVVPSEGMTVAHRILVCEHADPTTCIHATENMGAGSWVSGGVTYLSIAGSPAVLRWLADELPATAQEIIDLEAYITGLP